jgi:hypothetical protein
MDIRDLLPSPPTEPLPKLAREDVDALLDRLFAPPSVDVGQVPMHGRSRLDGGEMRLALAILEDALRCVLRHHASRIAEQRLAAQEALQWMLSNDDAPPFTFVRICQLFDLEPDWIRQAVRQRLFATDSRQAAGAVRTSRAA